MDEQYRRTLAQNVHCVLRQPDAGADRAAIAAAVVAGFAGDKTGRKQDCCEYDQPDGACNSAKSFRYIRITHHRSSSWCFSKMRIVINYITRTRPVNQFVNYSHFQGMAGIPDSSEFPCVNQIIIRKVCTL